MEDYANYEFYQDEYNGDLSNDLFSSLIKKASREIDKYVNRKLTKDVISKLDEIDKYKLQYTACELCDYFNTFGSNSSRGKANIISIDGVSVHRSEIFKSDTLAQKSQIISNLPHDLVTYL